MKIINRESSWPTKTNFVDENGVFVGFDTDQQCCESFGWFISNKKGDLIENYHEDSADLPGWNFDPMYINKSSSGGDDGSKVEFRLVNGNREKFLTLFNHHNGYYSHGFEFVIPNINTHHGTL